MSNVSAVNVQLEAEVEGVGTFEVVQFSGHWALNAIPAASIVVATGRNAADGRTAATIHSNLSKISKLNRVKVIATMKGDWEPGIPWPSEPTVIFEGRVMGIGFLKNMGTVGFTIQIVHWLCDLDFSSSLASYSHPSNPLQFTFQAVMGSLVNTNVVQAAGIAQTAEAASINVTSVSEDLWAKAIKPFFCALASAEHVLPSGSLQTCAGLVSAKNDAALAALSKIEGEGGACGLERSCYTPPASLNIGDSPVSVEIASAIAGAIQQDSQASFGSTTLWSKIVRHYSPEFLLAVIPQVEKALVVPYTPALSDLYCKTISANDYNHGEFTGAMTRPVRAVILLNSTATVTNIPGGESTTSVAGCYSPDTESTDDGLVKIMGVPKWLANVTSSATSAGKTTGIKKRLAVRTNTSGDEPDQKDLRGNKAGHTREFVLVSARDIHDNFAHALYVNETLSGRSGTISGKLRFDIAPGSIVAIEGVTEKFISNDQLATTLVGAVVEVTIGINAEQGRAGTGFRFTHMRTISENQDEKTAVGAHPLYTTKFTGAPLVDAFQFPTEGCC